MIRCDEQTSHITTHCFT